MNTAQKDTQPGGVKSLRLNRYS